MKKSRHKVVEVTRSHGQLDPRCDLNDAEIKKGEEFDAYRRQSGLRVTQVDALRREERFENVSFRNIRWSSAGDSRLKPIHIDHEGLNLWARDTIGK